MKNLFKSLFVLGALFIATSGSASEVINLTSGVDTATVLTHPASNGAFAAAFTPADFAAADAGPAAVILNAGLRTPTSVLGGPWIDSLVINPAAQWIADVDGSRNQRTALYAFPFTITETDIASAFITVYFAADDFLGDDNGIAADGPNESVYINGIAIGAEEGGDLIAGNNFTAEYQTSRINITSAVNTGANMLYLLQTDGASSAGLMAHAVIEILNSPQVVPTLNIWSLLLLTSFLGYLGVIRIQCKRSNIN